VDLAADHPSNPNLSIPVRVLSGVRTVSATTLRFAQFSGIFLGPD
jgi:hypothetical protein